MTLGRSREWLVKIALLCGFALTAIGVRKIGIPNYSPQIWDSFPSHIFFMLLFGACVIALAKSVKIHFAWAGCVVFSIAALLAGSLWPLIGVIGIFAAFFAVGRIFLLFFSNRNSALPARLKFSALSTTMIGAGIYGSVVCIVAQFPVNYAPAYFAALVIPIILRRRDIAELVSEARASFASIPLKGNLVTVATIAVGMFYLAVAMMPEVGFDALAIHLYVPARLTHDHVWAFDPDKYVWALMPMFADWLFSIAYMVGGETCTRMINVAFIFTVCAYIRDITLWLGGDRKGAAWASLLFLCMPLAFTESVSLFVDTVWTTFVLAGLLHVFRAIQRDAKSNFEIILGGFFLGIATAGKAVTFMILPATFVVLVLGLRRISRARDAAIGFGLFLIGSIPYIRSYLKSGNPVLPFYNDIFKSIYYPPVGFDPPPMFVRGVSWDILYKITFESGKYLESRDGAAGFAWLLLLVPAILVIVFGKHRRALAVLFIAVCAILLTFHSTAYLRYVLPSFALLATLIGYAYQPLSRMFPKYPRLIPGLCTLAVVLNVIFLNSSTFNGELNVEPLLGEAARANYLLNKIPLREVVLTVNTMNRDEMAVGFFAPELAAGLKADAIYFSWYNFRFSHLINTSQTPEETAQVLISSGIDYSILDANWGTPAVRKKIEDTTSIVWSLGSLSIRRVKDDFFFKTELMENPDFQTNAGWAPAAKAYRKVAGALEITDDTPAFQISKVEPKRRYRNAVTVQCEKQAGSGRLQVNWIDAQAVLIRSDSRAFDCSAEQKTHMMESVAPKGTDRAIVFAVATSNVPVTFRRVSLAK